MRKFLPLLFFPLCILVLSLTVVFLHNDIPQVSPTISQAEASHTKDRKVVKKIVKRPSKISTPTRKPSATPTPTKRPTPTATRTPTPTKSQPLAAPVTSSAQGFIMNAINDYRKSQGLSEVKIDKYTCDFAKTRAQEITSAFNHNGFRERIDGKSLPYPGYSSVTENIAMTSDYKKVVEMWINSSGHAENMRKDTPFVCVEQSGNYYAYEGWKPQ